jgi:hypothetical protein
MEFIFPSLKASRVAAVSKYCPSNCLESYSTLKLPSQVILTSGLQIAANSWNKSQETQQRTRNHSFARQQWVGTFGLERAVSKNQTDGEEVTENAVQNLKPPFDHGPLPIRTKLENAGIANEAPAPLDNGKRQVSFNQSVRAEKPWVNVQKDLKHCQPRHGNRGRGWRQQRGKN